MRPEHHRQIRTWISEEIAALRAQGATDVDMREEAFFPLVSKKILEHYWDEIHFARLNLEWLTDGRDSTP